MERIAGERIPDQTVADDHPDHFGHHRAGVFGDPVDLILTDSYSAADRRALVREFGFDQPLPLQYRTWLGHLLRGNWGTSMLSDRPVLTDVLLKLPVSLELVAVALLFAMLIALPAGILSASKPYSVRDYCTMTTWIEGAGGKRVDV